MTRFWPRSIRLNRLKIRSILQKSIATMGIPDFGKALHKLKGLGLDHVVNAAKALAKERGREAFPTAYIDASILGFKFRGDGSSIKILIEVLLKEGFQISVVFDPPYHHHSKLASIYRAGKREDAHLTALRARSELIRLSSPDTPEADKSAAEEKMAELEKLIKKCENQANNTLLPGFHETTMDYLEGVDLGSRGGLVAVCTALFQADTYILEAAIAKTCDLVIANDGDYAVYVGCQALLMMDFKLYKLEKKIAQVELWSGFLSMIQKAFHASMNLSESSIEEAMDPILDGVEDSLMRLAIAVAIGCDTLPGGVPGLSVTRVGALLKQHVTVESFLNALSKIKNAPSLAVLTTCLNALQFEPVGPLQTFDDESDQYENV